ncbi:MAG TPA: hypothetical protein VIW69_13940, partial [Candidatus Elarobacter sp.]
MRDQRDVEQELEGCKVAPLDVFEDERKRATRSEEAQCVDASVERGILSRRPAPGIRARSGRDDLRHRRAHVGTPREDGRFEGVEPAQEL